MPSDVPTTDSTSLQQIVRSVTIQAQAYPIMHAWCNPIVQERLFAGAAVREPHDAPQTGWRLNAPMDQHPSAVLDLLQRTPETAVHSLEGEDHWGATSTLTLRPAQGRTGTVVFLSLTYESDGMLAPLLARLIDPALPLMAGELLRRLRTWVEAGEVRQAVPSWIG